MSLIILGMLVLGTVMLVVGGEVLVRGATALASIAGISPLIIGLTVVSLGTSAPELAVSIQAGLDDKPDIAVGNVVGSNIFNTLVLLGLCAVIVPLVVSAQVIRREVPVLIGVSFMFLMMARDGKISFNDGLILAAGIVVYVTWLAVSSRSESAANTAEFSREFGEKLTKPPRGFAKLLINLGRVAVGLVILIFGARMMVDGASTLAQSLGVSDVIIGLTIVAIGTSLPEVVTSLIATLRGEIDIATGNAIGSSIFNILAILGLSALVTPGGLLVANSINHFDLPVMLLVTLACLPVFCTSMRIDRWKGGLLLAYYVAYTTYLVLDAMKHPALPEFRWFMCYVAFPITLILFLIYGIRELQKTRSNKHVDLANQYPPEPMKLSE